MADDKSKIEERMKKNIVVILNTMKEVILNPAGFFRTMPRGGGFTDPLIFVAGIGIIVGVVNLILSITGLGFAGSFGTALLLLIVTPAFTIIFGFVGAAIMFVIWKIMGSQEPFETAYRCGAYAAAITPVTTILGIVPYLGAALGLVWMTYLVVCASIEVHAIRAQRAWIVFGVLFGILLVTNLSATYSTRHLSNKMEGWSHSQEEFEKLTPEEKGKAVGEFLKGVQKAVDTE